MLARIARVGGLVLCATALLCALTAGTAAANQPRARASVIGGTAADLQQWGFAVAVLTPTTLCTGSVLSPTRVLTTAHCAGNPATMTVRANSTSAFVGGEALGVSSVTIAPGWAHGFESDLSVLTLSAPTSAPAIQLASPAEDASFTQSGAPLSVAGFGSRNPVLFGKAKLGLLTTTSVFARRCPLPSWAICDAGGRSGLVAFRRIHDRVRHRPVQKSICQGDSGGPLVASTPQGPRLVGVAEASSSPNKRDPFFFVRCGLKGYPALHTRVLSYADFIQANEGP
ncbi:MAG: S1 family peptidase [Solirubrobacterales bacterium]